MHFWQVLLLYYEPQNYSSFIVCKVVSIPTIFDIYKSTILNYEKFKIRKIF